MFKDSVKDLFKKVGNNRFKDFVTKKIVLIYYGAFLAEKNFNFNN